MMGGPNLIRRFKGHLNKSQDRCPRWGKMTAKVTQRPSGLPSPSTGPVSKGQRVGDSQWLQRRQSMAICHYHPDWLRHIWYIFPNILYEKKSSYYFSLHFCEYAKEWYFHILVYYLRILLIFCSGWEFLMQTSRKGLSCWAMWHFQHTGLFEI